MKIKLSERMQELIEAKRKELTAEVDVSETTEEVVPEVEKLFEPIVAEAIKIDATEFGSLLESEGISEEFKAKAIEIFEAALNARLEAQTKKLNEAAEEFFTAQIEAQVAEHVAALDESADEFLSSVASKWAEENKIALQAGIRVQIAENIISGVRNLLADNYIEVPENKADLVEGLEERIAELTVKLEEQVKQNGKIISKINESAKDIAIEKFTRGMTDVKAAKIRELAEAVAFESAEKFDASLKTLVENFAAPAQTVVEEKPTLTEENVEVEEGDRAVTKIAGLLSQLKMA